MSACDPAADLTPAWHIVDRDSRRVGRGDLTPDDPAWTRSKGWALERAIGAQHYDENSNQGLFAAARRTFHELIEDVK